MTIFAEKINSDETPTRVSNKNTSYKTCEVKVVFANGDKKTFDEVDGLINIAQFKSIASIARETHNSKENEVVKVIAVGCVDGFPNNAGELMRYVYSNGTGNVIRPKQTKTL